jgi:hypothetical protein
MENRKYIYQKHEKTTGVIRIRLVNILSVLPSVLDSNYPCSDFILLVNVFSVLHSVTDSNYPSGAFKPLVNVLSVLP